MTTIKDITNKYKTKIDPFDLELILADSLKKTREFILIHPEHKIPKLKIENCELKIARRAKGEPIAHILGHKEFYGLDFIVNNYTLIPRPETELMVEQAIKEISNFQFPVPNLIIADIGTGSGCIITSIAHNIKHETWSMKQKNKASFFAIDVSIEALKIAKKNARKHNLNKKIKFIHGSLLSSFIENSKLKIENSTIVIMANLPYLSKEIFDSAAIDVKKFEPKSALYSPEHGLQHYRKLLEQIKKLIVAYQPPNITCFFEISPEQKVPLSKIIKSILPTAKIEFQKDLAKKWRLCKITH